MDKSKPVVINILKFLKPYWRKLFCAMIFSAMEVSALLLMPIFLKNFIDSGLEQKNLSSAYESLMGYFLIVMILVLSGFIKTRLLKRCSECSIKDAQLNLFSRITDSTFKISDSFTNGSLMSYIQNDSRDMLDTFSTTGISILQNIIRIIIGIVVLGSMNMKILFMLILFLPLYMLDVLALNKPIKESSCKLQEQKANLTEFLQESISAKAEILLLNRREWNLKRLNNTLKRNVHLSLVNDLWINVSSNLGFLIYWLAHILVYLVGAKYVVNGSISIGGLILAAQYMDNIYMPCKLLINDNAALQKSIVSGRRYFSLNKKLRENSYFSTSAKEHLSFSRSIEFKNVSFNYGSEDVLTNINLKITKGESVAIIGSSGSGKSTLLKLLLNLYSPTSGEILVDSVNLDTISKKSLYNDMGVVFQDVFLFNSSIKANILLSNLNASEAALSKACLNSSSQEFIELFSDGYETNVGERGSRLSGGQKQRISIARSLLKDSDIMIFDEPTSSLDSKSKQNIYETFKRLKNTGKTLIIVSHDPEVSSHVDRVIELSNGKVISQKGTR